MGWRWEAIKAATTGRVESLQQFFTPRYTNPPDRNTEEFLAMYGRNPRLSPVRKVATDLAGVEGKLYRIGSKGERKEIFDHPFLDLMRRPNPLREITRIVLWNCLEIHEMTKGEGVAIIERNTAGFPAELWPIPPHWLLDIPSVNRPYFVIRSRDGLQREIPIEDMFYIRDPDPRDPYGRGLGIAEAVVDEIETDEYMAKWAKKFFYNDATPPTLLSAPGMTKEDHDRFVEKWDDRHKGIRNAHKMGIIPRDVKAVKLSDSQKEMDFSQSRKDLRDATNAHFGIPPEIMGIVENSNRATATQAKIIYAENVLKPRLIARQDAINNQILCAWGDDLLWEYDDIVPEDTEFRLEMSSKGLASSALLLDEWREQNGWDALPNDTGKVLFVPFSMMTERPEDLTQSARQNDPTTPPTPPTPPQNAGPTPEAKPPTESPPNTEEVQQLEVAKDIALNGAQVTSLVQIARSVALGELDRNSAVEIITAAFPFDKAKAEQIIGSATPAEQAEAKADRRRRQLAAHRSMQQLLNVQERKGSTQLKRYFSKQTNGIVAIMEHGTKADVPDFFTRLTGPGLTMDVEALRELAKSALSDFIDWEAQEAELGRVLSSVWEDSFNAGAEHCKDVFGITAIQQPQLTDYMRQQGLKRVREITDVTRDKLANSLADGIAAGEGSQQLIKRIQEHMPDVQAERALTIATTEAHTSIMAGNMAQMKYGGIRTKTWVTAGDEVTRPSHADVNGDTVEIDKPFKNGLMFPGDPAGSPGEIINCRCDLMPGDF